MTTDTDSKPVDDLTVVTSCAPAFSGQRPDVPIMDYLESFNRIVTPVWVFDTDHSRVSWANQAALEMWRTESLDELTTREMGTEMSPTVAQRLKQYQQDFEQGASFTELWTIYPNGEPATMRCIFSGIRLDDGRMAMFCQGIEERADTSDTLRSAQALLHTTVMISLYDLEGRTLYSNPAARASQGDASFGLESKFVDPLEFDSLQHMLRRDAMASLVARIKTVHGPRWHEINARQSRDAVTGSPAVLISEVDVSDLKETERKAQYLAVHDILTGLPNRTFMQNELAQHLEKAKSEDHKLGLLFIDLDNFKTINDSLGHAVGDQLLIEVAERLRIHSSEGDIVTRLGGDEFVVFLHSVQSEAGILGTVKRLQRVLADPIHVGEHALLITPSMGISIFPDDGEDIETLMKHADLAMYEAKDRGRNRHCFFSAEMKERAANRMELEADLRRAVDNEEFELFYQPQVSFHTGQITGGEALLRWRHEQRGLLNPGDFIAVAEETGLIEPIGEWVIAHAADRQKQWADQGHDLKVSINLSPRQFRSEALVPTIEKVAATDGYNPAMLDLEITESLLMGDNQRIIHALQRLHEMGFNLAVDDFGTGYSNLAYLQRYPISCLKIDRSFVRDLHKTSAITQLIISMCKLLKVRIVAEGIEDVHQLEWLKLKGCHEYQGFYFSPPVPVAEFDQLLTRNDKTLVPGQPQPDMQTVTV
ncbi:MAG: putative bifunctional diguanylate cyclase/phosphodiesterase [Hyphomicrobiales bacterium]